MVLPRFFQPYRQLCIFLLLQALAGIVFCVQLWAVRSVSLSLATSSAVAVFASLYWQDGRWWAFIHALFLPLIVLMLWVDLNPAWYLLAFGISWLVFGRVAANRAPLYLSNSYVLEALAQHVPHGGHFLDVGAGSGTVVSWLAKQRPDLVLTGIEQAWLPWLVGRTRLPRSVTWLRGDYHDLDFGGFTVAYAFLSPVPMADLWSKARSEMPANSLFLSNSFNIPGVPPDEIIELHDWKGGKLLLWRI